MAAFSTIAMATMAATSMASAYSASANANAQADTATANAQRRYALKAKISEEQMGEQQQIAREEMTTVTRKIMAIGSQQDVAQAESGVAGNAIERRKHNLRLKEQEAKGKIAKEVDTNVINIAQGMLAEKIDTEALIAEADSRRVSPVNTAINMLGAGVGGALQGYQVGSQLSKMSFSSGNGISMTGGQVHTANIQTNNSLSSLGSFNQLTR